MFQRDDLAPRVVGDADDARRRGLPVQETLGTRARRRDVQIGAVGEALGTAVAIARARDLALHHTIRHHHTDQYLLGIQNLKN